MSALNRAEQLLEELKTVLVVALQGDDEPEAQIYRAV